MVFKLKGVVHDSRWLFGLNIFYLKRNRIRYSKNAISTFSKNVKDNEYEFIKELCTSIEVQNKTKTKTESIYFIEK